MEGEELPFVDDLRVVVRAPADAVFRCLTAHLAGSGLGVSVPLAHLLGAEPRRATSAPVAEGGPVAQGGSVAERGRVAERGPVMEREVLGEGATVPGFRVAQAIPGKVLRLTGRHRFSRYSLTFTLTTEAGGTVLSARTHAAFPGLHGRLYRLLVIASGGHRIAVMRILRSVRRRAENETSH